MYVSHWGLDESPFRTSLDSRYFFSSPTHEEALARLQFLSEDKRRLGLLLGLQGSGKSLLLRILAQQIRRQGGVAVVSDLLGASPRSLLWDLASQLSARPRAGDDTFLLWRRVSDRLAEQRHQQLLTVLLLDDADEAEPEVLTQVTRLVQSQPGPTAGVTTVLAADGRRVPRLGDRLLGLAELRVEIEPWGVDDIRSFLRSSVSKAGGVRSVFDSAAAARLHELSGGIPRHVSQLANLALLAGAGRRLAIIDPQTIDEVHGELSVT